MYRCLACQPQGGNRFKGDCPVCVPEVTSTFAQVLPTSKSPSNCFREKSLPSTRLCQIQSNARYNRLATIALSLTSLHGTEITFGASICGPTNFGYRRLKTVCRSSLLVVCAQNSSKHPVPIKRPPSAGTSNMK